MVRIHAGEPTPGVPKIANFKLDLLFLFDLCPRAAWLPVFFESMSRGSRRENWERELAYFTYEPFQFT